MSGAAPPRWVARLRPAAASRPTRTSALGSASRSRPVVGSGDAACSGRRGEPGEPEPGGTPDEPWLERAHRARHRTPGYDRPQIARERDDFESPRSRFPGLRRPRRPLRTPTRAPLRRLGLVGARDDVEHVGPLAAEVDEVLVARAPLMCEDRRAAAQPDDSDRSGSDARGSEELSAPREGLGCLGRAARLTKVRRYSAPLAEAHDRAA